MVFAGTSSTMESSAVYSITVSSAFFELSNRNVSAVILKAVVSVFERESIFFLGIESLFDTIFNSKLRFFPVKNRDSLIRFYDSIGWVRDYNKDYLNCNLGFKISESENVIVGSGHFVATYKRDIFDEIKTYIEFKMGGSSEQYLDKAPLKKDYWRVTTSDNHAFHMGNTLESWMSIPVVSKTNNKNLEINFSQNKKISPALYFIKNKLFVKIISIKWIMKWYLKYKRLPKDMVENY